MSYFVYIIESQKNGSYYIGSTGNPQNRLKDHNSGRSIYTKRNRPYRIVFQQEFESITEARYFEKKIKSWKRRDFIEKIIRDGKIRVKG